MTRPRQSDRFGERLDWLLRSIPRRPGATGAFDPEDLVDALAGATGGTSLVARADARAWIAAMREQDADVDAPHSRRYLAIVEDTFRLPADYFRDEAVRRAADDRILLARDAAERRVRVIGPCRVRGVEWSVEELHSLHRQARDQLERRAGA